MTDSPSPAPSAPRPADSADWIVAPATPPGRGAVAIVRLDGPGCWDCARGLLDANPATPPAPPPPRQMRLVTLTDPRDGAPIDRALLVHFPAPHSYTGNDLLEFHCHGSPAIVEHLIETLRHQGARLARPGEFTERAFFNGRLDLAQAEAVANLVTARTRAAGRAALAQLEGALSRQLGALREQLLDLAAELEARVDFPEEEIERADRRRLDAAFDALQAEIERLLAGARRGRLQRDGARVVLAGRPNAGKSSLFNALLGRERAIVSPHPGTTRDSIEATIDLGGIPLVLVDTAGLRDHGAGDIESLGIDRTRREIAEAQAVLHILDATQTPDDDDRRLIASAREVPLLLVANKCELPDALSDDQLVAELEPAATAPAKLHRLSVRSGRGIATLEQALLAALIGAEAEPGDEALVTNQRHSEKLQALAQSLHRARAAFDEELSPEFPMVDLHEALAQLDEILGQSAGESVLDRIFSKFCIGK